MNFVFISPGFPKTYYQFCEQLQNKGVNVLAIGDTPYDYLSNEVKTSVHEYYYVHSMEDYDQMVRAVGYFTFKYGKIDWLESNNEYWIEQDARLRTDFNITTGFKNDIIENVKRKSLMKAYYKEAGIPTARYHLMDTLENALKFVEEVGYPLIIKPDNGMGAQDTHKINNQKELEAFYALEHQTQYIIEEFIEGVIESYDGIASRDHQVMFETSHVFPNPIMDVANNGKSMYYYSQKEIPEDLKAYGRAAVKAFPVNGRCFHMEFFRLTKDKPGLAKKGELAGIEVNMRMPGAYTPDMMNYACNTNVYEIYADMAIKGFSDVKIDRKYHCIYCGRRDGVLYKYSHQDIMNKYSKQMVMNERMPDILSDDMGNYSYTAVFETKKELEQFVSDIFQGG